LSWARSSYLIGDDLVLYRTFVAPGSPNSPSYSVYRVDPVDRSTRSIPDHVILPRPSYGLLGPLRGHFLTYKENRKSSQGFYCICNQSLSLRSPGHVRIYNTIPSPVSITLTLKYYIRNIAQGLWPPFFSIIIPGRSKQRLKQIELSFRITCFSIKIISYS
jgi:hypothetical protein